MESEKKEDKGKIVSSATSSPSHEFSFTISLHSSSAAPTTEAPPLLTPEKTKQQTITTSPLAIDLTPADEIFFHGHLLPLHFLSHLHAASTSSPRLSANSIDSFSLPIHDIIHADPTSSHVDDDNNNNHPDDTNPNKIDPKGGTPRKPFSLFGLPKWRKGSEPRETETRESKKKIKFDSMSQFLKRYVKMVKPLLTPKGGRRERESVRFRRQTYSFSGTGNSRERREVCGRRGELFSAPASMRASPTNSGVLVATAGGGPLPSSDSTMEELQAAIQAAIAHCKNSIAAEKKPQDISVPVN